MNEGLGTYMIVLMICSAGMSDFCVTILYD